MDMVQRLREAIVAIVDTNADVQALTGRANGNIVSWDTLSTDTLPVVAYQFITSHDGPSPMLRGYDFQFTAVAATESAANALIGVVSSLFSASAFAALAVPVDAALDPDPGPVRRSVPYDDDAVAYRADVDLTINAAP